MQLKETGECIGACGLGRFMQHPHFPEGIVEVGWRMPVRHWGKGYATEAASALLADAFSTRGLSKVTAIAVPANTRSTSVMRRIGMSHDPALDFDHPGVSEALPLLKRHVTHSISKSDWERLHIL